MSKIIVDRVEIRNFLSYGNTWTEFDFNEGINVVLGYDKDKERSNGAGKTSFLEAIPFALFGQINKGIALPKIVNWRNGKKCEVRLHFHKDGIPYIVHRGIKPGTLTLFKEGVEVPKLSDKRLFQAELENDLIGMDFKAAQALLFQNANNMVSMFNTPKAEKRRFIEKFFNLEIYSKAIEVTNRKISNVDKKLDEIGLQNSHLTMKISELQHTINSFQAPNLELYEGKLTTLQGEYDTFIGENPDLDEHLEFLTNLRTELIQQRDELNVKVMETKEKLGDIRLEIRTMETEARTKRERIEKIGDLSDQRDKLTKVRAALTKFGGEEEVIESKRAVLEEIKDEIKTYERLITECKTDRKRIVKECQKWVDMETTDATECPTCFQEVDHEHIKDHIESILVELNKELNQVDIEIGNYDSHLVEVNEKSESITGTITLYEERLGKKRQLEQALVKLQGVEEKELELSELESRVTEIDTVILPEYHDKESVLLEQVNVEDQEYKDSVLGVTNNDTLIDKCKDLIREKQKISNELDTAKSILDNQKEIHDRLIGEHEANIATKAQLESEIVSTQSEVSKLEKVKDYLEHIKFTLKDENVKQYAISAIIPFLQQQTNHYLAETGHNYYVEIDNWLDGQIQGFGVGECDFGNMSGGEGKSIDLALKFAMMDVARRQAGSYLDVLVLDELLDSSIDSFGLEKTMDIVRLKQREDNLKVFIVSHREEVAGFGADYTYQVTKENGMSTIDLIDG